MTADLDLSSVNLRLNGSAVIGGVTGTVSIGSLSGAFLERMRIASNYTDIYYSDYSDVRFSCQSDGNVVVYQSSVAVWDAGVAISDARYKKNISQAPVS